MSRESLLNLDTLTEEERNIILSVLRKDDELKKTQDRKIGQLKLEIQAIRMKSVLRNGDDLTKICARCHAELGFLFNRGDLCPKCHFKVCRACQEVVLDGTWLCILCHKQRQLKFFMQEWNRGKPTNTKRTGTELVKASMIKQRRPGRVNDEHNQPDKTRGVQNGNPVHNGSAFRSKKEAESERIEYPNDSDRRKLTQLFDAFKLNKSNEKPEQTESKTQVSVKKLSTRRYDDSDDDSSSSDDDRPSRDTLSNVPQRIKDSHSAENVSLVEHVPRGVLQRNYSDDSDQTAMSDETPFLKSTGSTETQIRVEIHSDSSGTPQKNKPPISDQSSDKIKHSRSNYANDGVIRAESMSSYRSTSPEIIDTPSLQRQAYSHNRSPSPYSFDSIPSSHADSPLPKRKLSELQRKDSDADSRISGISGYSGVSGAAEHSGTESVVKDSGEEEYVVEEVTNIKFRRVSRKHKGSSSSSPVDDIEAHQGGSSGKGRVDYVDIPKALIKVSEISVSDIEKDIDSENEGYVNLDLISMATSPTHGKGLIGAGGKLKKTDSPKQSKKYKMEPKSEKSTQNQKSNVGSKSKKETVDSVEVVNKKAKTANRLNKSLLSDNKSERQSPKAVDKARLSSKSEMELEQKETTIHAKELLNQLLTGKSDIQTNMSSTGAIDLPDTRAVVPKPDNKTGYVPIGSKQSANVQPKHEKMKSKESKTSLDINRETDYDASFEDIVSDVQKSGSKSEGGTKSVPGKDSEFDELFNIAMADLSVEESTDMSDTGSISRAKGKKLKHLKRKKKTEKTDEQEKIKQPSSGAELKQTDAEPMNENQHTDHEVLEKRSAHLQKTEDAIIVTEEEISPICVIKKEEQISPLHVIKKEEKISPAHLIKQEEVTEEEISPVRIIKEEVTLFSVDKLEEIATSHKHDLNKSKTKEMDKKRKDASKSNDEHSTTGKTAQSVTENLQGTSLETESHSQHRDDIKLESLSLHEIMELMRNNVLPMDEELLRLIEEQFAQNRDIVLPSLITNGGSDSDELSIIHEESEPSESDTSLENKSLQESKPVVIGDIPEVKVEDYEEILSTLQLSSGREVIPADSKENNVTKMEVSDITIIVKDDQNSKKVENTEIHNIYDHEQSEISADLTDEIKVKARENSSSCSETNNTQSNTQELEQFYKDIKQKVALEYYMETQKKSSTSPVNDGITDNMNKNILTKDPDKTNTKESLSDVSGLGQQSDDALSNVKTQLFQENCPETDIYNLSNECLQSIDIENSQTIELRKKIIPDVDINYEKDIRSETSVDKFTEIPSDSEQSQISPRSVVVSQFTRPSSVTLEVDESDSESYIAITSNESGSPVKIVSELKIEVPQSSPVQDKEKIILNEVDEGSDPTKTPCRKEGYQKFGTPFPGGHTPSRDENSADITLTPTNKSGDSEGTFCASFVADSASDKEVKDIISRKSKEKSDIVGQSLSREVLVKQWLSSKTEIRDDSSSPQSDLSEIASINPALQPESPACGLSSQEIPKLNMQDWKESEAEIATKLSPRASSEGSASFEDSGHVSGASTQENTPEHRRTDSLQSQTSMGSSKLSTVTDKESEDDPDIDEIVRSHKSLQSSLGSSRGNLLSSMTESRESLVSYYSNAGDIDYGKIPVTGDIQFGLDYNYRTGTLEIHICQCKGLAPADTRRNRSDPYVKTYLLPDKTRSGKRKTKIKKHTLNPTFDEKLRYLISKSELENRTVWVTVWHNDRFGRNDFLGEVTINFDYYRFGDSAPKWYKLQERFEQPTSMLTYKGDIILCLKYVPPEKVNRDSTSPSPTRKKIKKPKMPGDKGQLHVLIREARNLTAVRSNGYSDPFCKGQLQPDKEKQKTPVIKKECNPAWNHTMVFDDVTVDSLKEKSLELTIWDYDKLSSNDFLGGVRLNLGIGRSFGKIVDWMDARGEEISLWQAMLDRPNFWIDGALVLRPTMNKRR